MNMSHGFFVGAHARCSGKAFLSNPFMRDSADWTDFRKGWLEEDAILRGVEKSTIED